jgi:hypothetical protein
MKNNKKIAVLIVALLVIVSIGIGTYLYLRNPGKDNVKAIERLVGRHYVLPDEEPALATIEDRTKLNSEFLKSAENGDKLLIYEGAKKVILYRPKIDRIIEVGPISIAPMDDSVSQ